MIRFLRLFLFPFTIPYFLITEFRNFLFQTRIMRGARFDRPVISIGNLSTGGTGKTPLIEFLIRILLHEKINPAALSRGYGRKLHGYRTVKKDSKVTECGDEPLQIKQKFENIDVSVCEKRVDGIIEMIKENKKIDVVLLDDAYQHRAVKPSFSILTTSFYEPFFTDFILPVGNLREMRKNASRADVIVVTKCPDWMTETEATYYIRAIRRYSKSAPIYFSKIIYKNIRPVFGNNQTIELTHHVLLVTGIANTHDLESHLSKKSTFKHLRFGDHHGFSEKDIQKITELFNSFAREDKIILTTEKDAKRFQSMNENMLGILKKLPLYYIEMETEFIQSSYNESFEKLILSHVRKFE